MASASASLGSAERRDLGRPLLEQVSAEPTAASLVCPGGPSPPESVGKAMRPEQESGTYRWSRDGQAVQSPPGSHPGSPGHWVTRRPQIPDPWPGYGGLECSCRGLRGQGEPPGGPGR